MYGGHDGEIREIDVWGLECPAKEYKPYKDVAKALFSFHIAISLLDQLKPHANQVINKETRTAKNKS